MGNSGLDELLAQWCTEADVYGAAAGVRRPGRADELVAWGVDGRDPETPMTTSGRFRVASITKTFTGALVLDLASRGDLALESTIEVWLPDFPNASSITIRSLLDHTAGTADMNFDAMADYIGMLLADLERRYTPGEFLALTAAFPPHDVPGATYRYSNTDYCALGFILEAVTGRSFATLVSEVTTPRQLAETSYDDGTPDDLQHGSFDLSSDGQPNPALDRSLDTLALPNTALISTAFAAGGMTSSLRDLLTWTEALYAGDVLAPAMRAELLASPEHDDPMGGCHGLGVFGYGTRSPDGVWTAYGHTGNIVGSSVFVVWFPASGATVAIHTNVLEVPVERFVALGVALNDAA